MWWLGPPRFRAAFEPGAGGRPRRFPRVDGTVLKWLEFTGVPTSEPTDSSRSGVDATRPSRVARDGRPRLRLSVDGCDGYATGVDGSVEFSKGVEPAGVKPSRSGMEPFSVGVTSREKSGVAEEPGIANRVSRGKQEECTTGGGLAVARHCGRGA